MTGRAGDVQARKRRSNEWWCWAQQVIVRYFPWKEWNLNHVARTLVFRGVKGAVSPVWAASALVWERLKWRGVLAWVCWVCSLFIPYCRVSLQLRRINFRLPAGVAGCSWYGTSIHQQNSRQSPLYFLYFRERILMNFNTQRRTAFHCGFDWALRR